MSSAPERGFVVRSSTMSDLSQRLRDLVDRLELRPAPDPAVDAEVAAWVAAPGLDDGLADETAIPYVTIDNEGSRDLDQALFVDRQGSDFVLRYALADASYYARPGTALWRRALAMGSSYYLPGFAIPMLPEALSEGLVSLNPNVLRRALVCRPTRRVVVSARWCTGRASAAARSCPTKGCSGGSTRGARATRAATKPR